MIRSRRVRINSIAAGVALAVASSGWGANAWPSVRVEAPPELAREAAAVRAVAAEDFTAVMRLVGLAVPGSPIRVVLAGNHSALARNAPTWVSGYALPTLDTIVVFSGRVPSYPDRNLDTVVRHEIAHVLLARAARGRPLPRWFDEGTATVAAREWGIEDSARVVLATVGPRSRSLADIDGWFASADGATVARGYAMSAALVRQLFRRCGEGAVARIAARVAAGASFDEAFASTAGDAPEGFARAYFRREAIWNAWVPFLTSATALWMGITLLALLAIRRRRERDASLRAGWAAEEAARHVEVSPNPEDDSRHWN
ncbi:MAG: hypothetical protein ACHQQS_03290 [Thermoanaerobaculales bacterium]